MCTKSRHHVTGQARETEAVNPGFECRKAGSQEKMQTVRSRHFLISRCDLRFQPHLTGHKSGMNTKRRCRTAAYIFRIAKEANTMIRWLLTMAIAAVAILAFSLVSCHSTRTKLAEVKRELADLKAAGEQVAAATAAAQQELAASRKQLVDLQREKEAAARALEEQLRGVLKSKDITISELQGRLTVNILDRVMFDLGETKVKPEGQAVLLKVAQLLKQVPDRQVLVIGHTDNVPVGPKSKSGCASNWELSMARATAAVRFLAEKGGVDPRRIGAAGYGEFRPVADNATTEGRARNRRIAIVILGDDLLGGATPLAPASVADSGAAVPAVGDAAAPGDENR
jgi:chemotaxis protein MotB